MFNLNRDAGSFQGSAEFPDVSVFPAECFIQGAGDRSASVETLPAQMIRVCKRTEIIIKARFSGGKTQ
jgi:hypothetical protein